MGQTGYYHQVSMGRYLTPRPPKLTNDRHYDYQIRLVLVGDAACGKSTLVNRYVKDEKTIGQLSSSYHEDVETPKRKVLEKGQKKISLQIVDTAGQERYRSLTASHYANAHGCLIVFDLTRKTTFDNIHRWSEEIHENAPNGVRIMLVGTNCNSRKREIPKERAESLASSIGVSYVEVSTQDNLNITKPFDKLIDMIIENLQRKTILYQFRDKELEKKLMSPRLYDLTEVTDSCVIS